MNYGVKFPAEYSGALGIFKNPKFDHQIWVFLVSQFYLHAALKKTLFVIENF